MTNGMNRWLKAKLVKLRKGRCEICGRESSRLQFAHRSPTKLSGTKGRGRIERYYDFIHNRDKYALVCGKSCNDSADGRRTEVKPSGETEVLSRRRRTELQGVKKP